jgi:serine/threonine protein kinase
MASCDSLNSISIYFISFSDPRIVQLSTSLARAIGRVLAILHKNNIIHGDLTSSNILLQHDDCIDLAIRGNVCEVCWMLFGLINFEGLFLFRYHRMQRTRGRHN